MVLEGLSKQGTRVYGFLESGVKQGLSGRKILSILREQGLGYRESTFYKDLRIIKSSLGTWRGMENIRRDARISEEYYRTAKSPLSTRYQTVFEIVGRHKETGEIRTFHSTVGHDTLLSRRELEEYALEGWGEGQDPSDDYEPIRIVPVEARKTREWW